MEEKSMVSALSGMMQGDATCLVRACSSKSPPYFIVKSRKMPGLAQQAFSQRSQSQTTTRTLKQRPTRLVFQSPDMLTDRSLRQTQLIRRVCHAGAIGHSDEGANQQKIECTCHLTIMIPNATYVKLSFL
ncbi:hypothetical protein AA13594_3223 [Gluconacetobacter azotocaptans DSM 13594]|nr:hypothetical protein AA13594_3223 [Gluconacetobacter azotocaptans DSM 13594]